MSDSVILKPKETMVQLKKDHEVLGEEDTLFCVLEQLSISKLMKVIFYWLKL